MSIEATQELAARYGVAWAKHDLDAIIAMHTDDTVFHLHGFSEPAIGLAAAREVNCRHVRSIARPTLR